MFKVSKPRHEEEGGRNCLILENVSEDGQHVVKSYVDDDDEADETATAVGKKKEHNDDVEEFAFNLVCQRL